jgi:hypothetical protein
VQWQRDRDRLEPENTAGGFAANLVDLLRKLGNLGGLSDLGGITLFCDVGGPLWNLAHAALDEGQAAHGLWLRLDGVKRDVQGASTDSRFLGCRQRDR